MIAGSATPIIPLLPPVYLFLVADSSIHLTLWEYFVMSTGPSQVPGSTHYASVLAYGDFMLADGNTIHCDGIQGISAVVTSDQVQTLPSGQPRVDLTRILTHFHWPSPEILIEQHPSLPSTGTLTGTKPGGTEALLPGKATFYQHIILTFNGRPLANREPLVMTAQDVTQWPPIGSNFFTEAQTDFYDLADLDNPDAQIVASLCACKTDTVSVINLPQENPT